MKLFFALASITFSSALSMDHTVENPKETMHELLINSEWLDGDTGKLCMYFKICRGETTIQTDGVIQIAGSKKQCLSVLPSLKQLRNRNPAIPFALVRTFRWIKGNLEKIGRDDFSIFPNVEEIDLHSNHIENVDPNAFWGLKKLKKIWLDDNKLSQRKIAELKKDLDYLEVLDCHGQRTSAEEEESEPTQLPQNSLVRIISPSAISRLMRWGLFI